MSNRAIQQKFSGFSVSFRFCTSVVALLAGMLMAALPAAATTPTLTITPSSLSFSDIVVNTSASSTLTVKNTATGSNPITFTSIGASGSSYFTQSNTCLAGKLGAGKTCTITVTFKPQKVG